MALVEYRLEERIAYITLNRPEKLNAINDDLNIELVEALYRLNDDDEAIVGILSGNGKAFCSGADVQQRQLRSREELAKKGGVAHRNGNVRAPLFNNAQAPKPLIAAMHGYAFGVALRYAMYCDLSVASKGTKFQVTEVSRGIDATSAWSLIAGRSSTSFADDVCLTGRVWAAEEAHARGLITRLAEPGQHMEAARELALQVASNPPLAVRAVVDTRRALIHEQEVRVHAMRPRGLHLTEDFRESALAFVEKRKPVFKGR